MGDDLAVRTIRALAADTVHKANSGHPGAPLGLAAAGHILWSQFLNFIPGWLNRDRFVLSGGHGCALLYSLLHLHSGIVTLDDLKSFRQLGSKCSGHPERHLLDGVEATTGPLGQGVANGVGLALIGRHMAAKFNRDGFPIFTSNVWTFCGDGDLMEGISHEAACLAGSLKIPGLILCWDDNRITICGDTKHTFAENTKGRFEAYGWQVLDIPNADTDLAALYAGFAKAQELAANGPVFVDMHTVIGYASPLAGSNKVHGAPLNKDQMGALKEKLGFSPDEAFVVAPAVYELYKASLAKVHAKKAEWDALYANYAAAFPDAAKELAALAKPEVSVEVFKTFVPLVNDKVLATRQAGQVVLNAIAAHVPGIFAGSADVTPSTLTWINGGKIFTSEEPTGQYIEYGVREIAMGAMANGLQYFGLPGIVPIVSTFFVFVQYLLPALRISALEKLRVVYVMTHDGIGVGEDGATHQNVENFAVIRALPGAVLMRPADLVETSACYTAAFTGPSRPAVICLSRQATPNLNSSFDGVLKGGYVIQAAEKPALVLCGTGTELAIAIDAASKLSVSVQVVSLPCLELFDEQPLDYKRHCFPKGVPVISVEAGVSFGWAKYSHKHVGVDRFGMSAPAPKIYAHLGITGEGIAKVAEDVLAFYASIPVPDLLERP